MKVLLRALVGTRPGWSGNENDGGRKRAIGIIGGNLESESKREIFLRSDFISNSEICIAPRGDMIDRSLQAV